MVLKLTATPPERDEAAREGLSQHAWRLATALEIVGREVGMAQATALANQALAEAHSPLRLRPQH
jgi:hypothetical protein